VLSAVPDAPIQTRIAYGTLGARMTGELFDGTPFEGCDEIRTIPDGRDSDLKERQGSPR